MGPGFHRTGVTASFWSPCKSCPFPAVLSWPLAVGKQSFIHINRILANSPPTSKSSLPPRLCSLHGGEKFSGMLKRGQGRRGRGEREKERINTHGYAHVCVHLRVGEVSWQTSKAHTTVTSGYCPPALMLCPVATLDWISTMSVKWLY